MAVPAEKPRYSFADVLAWDDSERVEIIDGEAFMMATPLTVHQRISGRLFWEIYDFLRGKICEVFHAPFGVRLFEQDGDRPEDVDTMVEPDLTVVCDPEKLDKFGCKGAPDMVIEILSPSNRRHDLGVKYRLYERAGVREYWVVDPEKKTVQVCRLEDGLYGVPEVYLTGKVPVGLWEDFRVDLGPVFAE